MKKTVLKIIPSFNEIIRDYDEYVNNVSDLINALDDIVDDDHNLCPMYPFYTAIYDIQYALERNDIRDIYVDDGSAYEYMFSDLDQIISEALIDETTSIMDPNRYIEIMHLLMSHFFPLYVSFTKYLLRNEEFWDKIKRQNVLSVNIDEIPNYYTLIKFTVTV